jgi:hypothetical protein
MKSKVMDRPMFKKGEDFDPENVGIMSGFKDMDIDELFEDEMEGDDLYDSSDMLDRRPDSPEILMNNLRGDMRSVDARREELADMVGYNAAMETPEEVLALLQGTLGGGIGGLAGAPEPAPMMPPPGPAPEMGGMMPGMGMPPEMGGMPPPEMGGMPAPEAAPPMPGGMPPLNMYQGGIVQRFSKGSDEDAVTPAESDASSVVMSPDQLQLMRFISQQASKPSSPEALRSAMASRVPIYQDVLGSSGGREAAQAQMLFDISGAALGFASNRGPQGEALKGSTISRFAGATRALPAQIGARAAEQSKQEQAVKLAALQSAERALEKQQELFTKTQIEEIKAAAKARESGKPTGSAFNQYQSLITPFVQGVLDQPGKIRLINTVTEMVQPTVVTITDKLGNISTEVRRNDIPRTFYEGLVSNYGQEAADTWVKSLGPDIKISQIAYPQVTTPVKAPAGTPTQVTSPAGVPAEVTAPASVSEAPAGTLPVITVAGAQQVRKLATAPAGDPGKPKIWSSRALIAGPINTLETALVRILPGMPPNAVDLARQNATKQNEQLIETLATNDGRIDQGEMNRLRPLIGLNPRVFGSEGAMTTALVSLDDALLRERESDLKVLRNPEAHTATALNKARQRLNLIDDYRANLGVPPRVYSDNDLTGVQVAEEYVDMRSGAFNVRLKDTFSFRDRDRILQFRKDNPGKPYGIILPDNKIQVYQ